MKWCNAFQETSAIKKHFKFYQPSPLATVCMKWQHVGFMAYLGGSKGIKTAVELSKAIFFCPFLPPLLWRGFFKPKLLLTVTRTEGSCSSHWPNESFVDRHFRNCLSLETSSIPTLARYSKVKNPTTLIQALTQILKKDLIYPVTTNRLRLALQPDNCIKKVQLLPTPPDLCSLSGQWASVFQCQTPGPRINLPGIRQNFDINPSHGTLPCTVWSCRSTLGAGSAYLSRVSAAPHGQQPLVLPTAARPRLPAPAAGLRERHELQTAPDPAEAVNNGHFQGSAQEPTIPDAIPGWHAVSLNKNHRPSTLGKLGPGRNDILPCEQVYSCTWKTYA